MSKSGARILRYSTTILLIFCAVVLVGLAITWSRWWWPVKSARVWVNGKRSSDVRIFRSHDGHYLIYYDRKLAGLLMDQDIVPGYSQPVESTRALKPFESGSTHADMWVFPFGAYSRSTPVKTEFLYGLTDMTKRLDFKREPHGFSYNNDMTTSNFWHPDREINYRVEFR